jgi:hypothetical protein
VELANGSTGHDEVKVGCLFAWNFCGTRSTVHRKAEGGTSTNMLSLH